MAAKQMHTSSAQEALPSFIRLAKPVLLQVFTQAELLPGRTFISSPERILLPDLMLLYISHFVVSLHCGGLYFGVCHVLAVVWCQLFFISLVHPRWATCLLKKSLHIYMCVCVFTYIYNFMYNFLNDFDPNHISFLM